MSLISKFLSFVLPTYNDPADIQVINANFESADAKFTQLDEKKAPLSQPNFIEENQTNATIDGSVQNSVTMQINGMPVIKKQDNMFFGGGGKKTTGNLSVANGTSAMLSNTTGYENVANGTSAMYSNTTGYRCAAVGSSSLYFNTTGYHLAALGHRAGSYLSNGSTGQTGATNSVFVGVETKGGVSDNLTNQIVIGFSATSQGSNTAHIGNTSISTISYGAGTGTAFTNRSDPRIKEDIVNADLKMCYDDIKNLPLHRFKYKDFVGNTKDKHLTGFLSTEFAQLLPKAVHKNTQSFDMRDEKGEIVYETKMIEELNLETGKVEKASKQVPKQIIIEDCESIDTSQIVPTLFGAVQHLMNKVEELERQLKEV